jgi:hypothetical protein
MALVRWPTDPKGKPPSHTKSWAAHQAALNPAAPAAPDVPEPVAVDTPVESPLPLIEPPDASFTAEIEGLGQTYRSDLAGNTEGRKRGLMDYGYLEDEATGGLSFDANNPFSRAALLKRNYDTQRRSSAQSMGAGGQLYSGAFQNRQDLVNRDQLGGEDSLQKSLGDFLLSNTDSKRKIGENYAAGLRRADESRLGRINENPLYSPTVSAADAAAVTPLAPAQSIGPAVVKAKKKPTTLKAGPGVKATKNTTVTQKKKGKTVTYSTSIKRP